MGGTNRFGSVAFNPTLMCARDGRTVCLAEKQERFKDYGAPQPPHQSSLNGALAPRSYGNCSYLSPRQLWAWPWACFHRRLWSKIKRQEP